MTKTSTTRIGILGAGQLALMLAEAGERLGVEVVCAGSQGDCAGAVAPLVEVNLDDAAEVRTFADQVDFVTIESENIDAEVLQGLKLHPNVAAVATAQDRLVEKRFFEACGIRVAPFAEVSAWSDFGHAMKLTGLPAILKTRRGGYDGKGQVRLMSEAEAEVAWAELGGAPCILEGMLRFDAEVSLIAARGLDGEIVFYPLTENHHREGILRTSVAPYANPELQTLAEHYLTVLLERMEYVGVLAVEFFVQGDALIANEMAPRVHNSGHWTIEGADTSQFENCLRAMCGLPLGSTESRAFVMLNCIGTMPALADTAHFPSVFRHDYGKEARPGRKVGHLTLPAWDSAAIEMLQKRLNEQP